MSKMLLLHKAMENVSFLISAGKFSFLRYSNKSCLGSQLKVTEL